MVLVFQRDETERLQVTVTSGGHRRPSWQQVSWLDTETGETGEQKLVQASGDAERFYRQVAAPALIGREATGNCPKQRTLS